MSIIEIPTFIVITHFEKYLTLIKYFIAYTVLLQIIFHLILNLSGNTGRILLFLFY
jgi:hypothetical protein